MKRYRIVCSIDVDAADPRDACATVDDLTGLLAARGADLRFERVEGLKADVVELPRRDGPAQARGGER